MADQKYTGVGEKAAAGPGDFNNAKSVSETKARRDLLKNAGRPEIMRDGIQFRVLRVMAVPEKQNLVEMTGKFIEKIDPSTNLPFGDSPSFPMIVRTTISAYVVEEELGGQYSYEAQFIVPPPDPDPEPVQDPQTPTETPAQDTAPPPDNKTMVVVKDESEPNSSPEQEPEEEPQTIRCVGREPISTSLGTRGLTVAQKMANYLLNQDAQEKFDQRRNVDISHYIIAEQSTLGAAAKAAGYVEYVAEVPADYFDPGGEREQLASDPALQEMAGGGPDDPVSPPGPEPVDEPPPPAQPGEPVEGDLTAAQIADIEGQEVGGHHAGALYRITKMPPNGDLASVELFVISYPPERDAENSTFLLGETIDKWGEEHPTVEAVRDIIFDVAGPIDPPYSEPVDGDPAEPQPLNPLGSYANEWRTLDPCEPYLDTDKKEYLITWFTQSEGYQTTHELDNIKDEARLKAFESLLQFYNKSTPSGVTSRDELADYIGKNVHARDSHLDGRPNSVVKVLVSIDADTFDAIPSRMTPTAIQELMDRCNSVVTFETSELNDMVQDVVSKMRNFKSEIDEFEGKITTGGSPLYPGTGGRFDVEEEAEYLSLFPAKLIKLIEQNGHSFREDEDDIVEIGLWKEENETDEGTESYFNIIYAALDNADRGKWILDIGTDCWLQQEPMYLHRTVGYLYYLNDMANDSANDWQDFFQSYTSPVIKIYPTQEMDEEEEKEEKEFDKVQDDADGQPFKTKDQLLEENKAINEGNLKIAKINQKAQEINFVGNMIKEGDIPGIMASFGAGGPALTKAYRLFHRFDIQTLIQMIRACIAAQLPIVDIPNPFPRPPLPGAPSLPGFPGFPWDPHSPGIPMIPTIPNIPELPTIDLDGPTFEAIKDAIIQAIVSAIIAIIIAILKMLLEECINNPANANYGSGDLEDLLNAGQPPPHNHPGIPPLPGATDAVKKVMDNLGIPPAALLGTDPGEATPTGDPPAPGQAISDLLDALSSILTPVELCLLLQNGASNETVDVVLGLIDVKFPALKPYLATRADVRLFFKELGQFIDPSLCQAIIDGLCKVPVADLCDIAEDYGPTLRENLCGKKVSLEECNRILEENRELKKKKLDDLTDFLEDPTVNLPNMLCGPDGDGIAPPNTPSMDYLNDMAIDALFEPIDMAFNMDIGAYNFSQQEAVSVQEKIIVPWYKVNIITKEPFPKWQDENPEEAFKIQQSLAMGCRPQLLPYDGDGNHITVPPPPTHPLNGLPDPLLLNPDNRPPTKNKWGRTEVLPFPGMKIGAGGNYGTKPSAPVPGTLYIGDHIPFPSGHDVFKKSNNWGDYYYHDSGKRKRRNLADGTKYSGPPLTHYKGGSVFPGLPVPDNVNQPWYPGDPLPWPPPEFGNSPIDPGDDRTPGGWGMTYEYEAPQGRQPAPKTKKSFKNDLDNKFKKGGSSAGGTGTTGRNLSGQYTYTLNIPGLSGDNNVQYQIVNSSADKDVFKLYVNESFDQAESSVFTALASKGSSGPASKEVRKRAAAMAGAGVAPTIKSAFNTDPMPDSAKDTKVKFAAAASKSSKFFDLSGEAEIPQEIAGLLSEPALQGYTADSGTTPLPVRALSAFMYNKISAGYANPNETQVKDFISDELFDGFFTDTLKSVSKTIAESPLFDKKILEQLDFAMGTEGSEDGCPPRPSQGLLGLDDIKEMVKKEYEETACFDDIDFGPDAGPGALEKALLTGIVYVIIRLFIIESAMMGIFLFSKFDIEKTMADQTVINLIIERLQTEIKDLGTAYYAEFVNQVTRIMERRTTVSILVDPYTGNDVTNSLAKAARRGRKSDVEKMITFLAREQLNAVSQQFKRSIKLDPRTIEQSFLDKLLNDVETKMETTTVEKQVYKGKRKAGDKIKVPDPQRGQMVDDLNNPVFWSHGRRSKNRKAGDFRKYAKKRVPDDAMVYQTLTADMDLYETVSTTQVEEVVVASRLFNVESAERNRNPVRPRLSAVPSDTQLFKDMQGGTFILERYIKINEKRKSNGQIKSQKLRRWDNDRRNKLHGIVNLNSWNLFWNSASDNMKKSPWKYFHSWHYGLRLCYVMPTGTSQRTRVSTMLGPGSSTGEDYKKVEGNKIFHVIPLVSVEGPNVSWYTTDFVGNQEDKTGWYEAMYNADPALNLRRLLTNSAEFKALFQLMLPLSRIVSVMAVWSITSAPYTMGERAKHLFDNTKSQLKLLFEVFVNGADYKYEDEGIKKAGGNAGLFAAGMDNASTDGDSNPALFLLALLTPIMIFKGLCELISPNIKVAKLIKEIAEEVSGENLGPLAPWSIGLLPADLIPPPFGFGPPITPFGIIYLILDLLQPFDINKHKGKKYAQPNPLTGVPDFGQIAPPCGDDR